MISRRRERQIGGFLLGLTTLMIAGLSTMLLQVTRRHGETLIELENQAQPAMDAPVLPPNRTALFIQHGMPIGSVCTNFDLPNLDGTRVALTQFRGTRTLLVFIAPDCPQSASLLLLLAKLPVLAHDRLQIILISNGDPEMNRVLIERSGAPLPLLLQENREISDAYYALDTPVAYLIGPDGLTEVDRIEGAQAILGVATAAAAGVNQMPVATRTALPPAPTEIDQPLHVGDVLPPFSAIRIGEAPLTHDDLSGRRTLMYMFDPFCAPCVELLADFARIDSGPMPLNVVMISRREPAETEALATKLALPFTIAYQDNREISHAIGARVFPAAFIVGPSLRLETEIAVGRRAISDLHRSLRREYGAHDDRRLVSLAAMLQRP